MATRTPSIVLFDAFGTLVRMEPPAPVLAAALRDGGFAVDDAVVEAALREEIAHYRAHMHEGRDPAGLAALRAGCGAVLARALGPGAPDAATATAMLIDALRFRLFDDVLPVLDDLAARGVRLGVVSNWDCALPDHLDRLGVAPRFEVIAASAAVGAAKPDPAIFRWALGAMGAEPGDALHVGDGMAEDYLGARHAGLAALLLRRGGPVQGADDIVSLAEVPARLTG